MPLRDHFHSPWLDEHYWEGFHSAWVNTIVRHLNGFLLPPEFRAVPQVHLGAWVEADVATFEKNSNGPARQTAGKEAGTATAVWTPLQPAHTLLVEFPNEDIFEVRVYDESRGTRLVGVVELTSPANKDRPKKVKAFTSKCVSYLEQQVGLVLVDVVTNRKVNFHKEIVELLAPDQSENEWGDLYAVAFRTHPSDRQWQVDTWPAMLTVGNPLPILPLWLRTDFSVPLDLEKSYEETCQVLRIV